MLKNGYDITRKIHSWVFFSNRLYLEKKWLQMDMENNNDYMGLFADYMELKAINVLEHKSNDRSLSLLKSANK